MDKNIPVIGGLKTSKPGQIAKRYSFGAIHPEINLADIQVKDVKDFKCSLTIRDQRADDDCTGHAVAVALEAHEGLPVSPKWQFMKTKLKEGDLESFGASLEDALSIPIDFGALPENLEPADIKDAPRNVYADWSKWPDLDAEAAPHEQKSYWWITQGGYPDLFSAIRAALWQHKDEKNLAPTGTLWRNSWTFGQATTPVRGIIAKDLPDNDPQSGHAFSLEDQVLINNEVYLVAHLSNGEGFGEHGHFFFPAVVVNKVFTYGTAMYLDYPKEVAVKINVNRSVAWNLKIAWMWKTLFKINELLKKLTTISGD